MLSANMREDSRGADPDGAAGPAEAGLFTASLPGVGLPPARRYLQRFAPSRDRFGRAAQSSGHLSVRHLPEQRIGFRSPVVAMGRDSHRLSSVAHVGDRSSQPACHIHIRSRAQKCFLPGRPRPRRRIFFPAWWRNAQPAAAMLHRHSADAQEQRNLRGRALAQQFVVGERPVVLLGIEDGQAMRGPARRHTGRAPLQPPRQSLVRHCPQQFLFRPTPGPPVCVERRDAKLAPALGDRLA